MGINFRSIKILNLLNIPLLFYLAISEINFLKTQIESANERIQRLQNEMLHVQAIIYTLTDKRKITIKAK